MTTIVSVEFVSPDGEELRFDWDRDHLGEFDPAATDPPVWQLAGKLDWDEVERVRVLSSRPANGGPMLVIAAILPAGAEGHGEEAIAGVLIEGEGEPEQLDEVLLSAEYDGDEELRRVGIELYRPGGQIPLRIAGEATGAQSHADGGVEHRHYPLELRGPNGAAVGVLEVLRAR